MLTAGFILNVFVAFIIFKIITEVLKGTTRSAITFVFMVFIAFFFLGGTMSQMKGVLGEIGKFYDKLPTTQFLNFIKDMIVNLFNNLKQSI